MGKKLSVVSLGWIYSFIHFSTEVACFAFIYSRFTVNTALFAVAALLYDALAFLPQGMFGFIRDNFPKLRIGALGTVMLAAAYFIPQRFIALVVLALGNALVHVEGAELTARGSGGKFAPSGVFVAGGSFGVLAGQLAGTHFTGAILYILPLSLTAISLLVTVLLNGNHLTDESADGFDVASDCHPAVIFVGAFFVVAVRAYVGYAVPMAWKSEAWHTAVLLAVMGFGKAIGGYAADRFGAKRTAVISLIVSLPFMISGNRLAVLSLVGTFFFSMTMPITYGILLSVIPDYPGVAFGITTIGLFFGTLPSFFYVPKGVFASSLCVSVLTLTAIAIFALCMTGNDHKTFKE